MCDYRNISSGLGNLVGGVSPDCIFESSDTLSMDSPGRTIHAFATAYAVDLSRLAPALQLLEEVGFEASFGPTLHTSHLRYLAGSAPLRAAAVMEAANHPARIAWAARGGYGTLEVLSRIDLGAVAAPSKIWVGYSDMSGLLSVIATRGGVAIHGPVLNDLTSHDPAVVGSLFRLLEQLLVAAPTPPLDWTLSHISGPRPPAAGRVFGGNFSTLVSTFAAGHLRLPEGAVLLLEDTQCQPYQVQRDLTVLLDGGYLEGVAAVVLGQFNTIPTPSGMSQPSVEEAAAEALTSSNIPLLAGAPVGHFPGSEPFVIGSTLRLPT